MIDVKNLSKSFGQKKAVENISFQVKKGDILGFLGPNGAGKSTTMRIITGYIPPTSGDASIGGFSVIKDPLKVKKKIGYLSETSPLYPEMTVEEFLSFCCEIRGYSGKEKDLKLTRAMERCFLKDTGKQQISTLSKGYRQRVSFAQSILHDPEYLIMDEPTDGLDPNQKHEVRKMIKEMSNNKAIILSTHILDEAAAICNRSIVIAHGQLIENSTPKDLCRKDPDFGAITMEISYENMEHSPVRRISSLEGIKSVQVLQNDEEKKHAELKIFLEKQETSHISSVMSLIEDDLSKAGCGIYNISLDKGNLSKVFRMLTDN